MQWYRMKKYRSSPSKETFLFSADLYGLEDKTSTMPAYVKLRNGNNCSFDNAESESYWDGTSNDDITDEYDMIWYDMIWYHWLSILRISVLTILLMNSRSISIWGNRPGSSSENVNVSHVWRIRMKLITSLTRLQQTLAIYL